MLTVCPDEGPLSPSIITHGNSGSSNGSPGLLSLAVNFHLSVWKCCSLSVHLFQKLLQDGSWNPSWLPNKADYETFPGELTPWLSPSQSQALYLLDFYPEFRFHIGITPHPYTCGSLLLCKDNYQKKQSCCTIVCSDSGTRASLPWTIQKHCRDYPGRLPGNALSSLHLESWFQLPPFVANGSRGGDIRPFLAAPFSQGNMHSIRGF